MRIICLYGGIFSAAIVVLAIAKLKSVRKQLLYTRLCLYLKSIFLYKIDL